MTDRQEQGASAAADRATAVEPVPVSPLRDGIPSAARWLVSQQSPIWDYAHKMGTALQKVLPADVQVQIADGIRVEDTVKTMQEAEALREVIRHLGQHLPSHRMMLASDIGAEPPKSNWKERLYKLLGAPAQGTEARRDETHSGSACDGPVPTGCAQTEGDNG